MNLLDNLAGYYATLNPDLFLGNVVWFTISGEIERPDGKRQVQPLRVNPNDMHEWFEELGLDKGFLPPRIFAHDAFRRAVSGFKAEYPLPREGQSALLRVVEVDSNNEFVLVHVMRDIRDRRKQYVVSHHVATLKFIRGGDAMRRAGGGNVKAQILDNIVEYDLDGNETGRREPMHMYDYEQVKKGLAEFTARYDNYREFMDGASVRRVIRNYVNDLDAVQCRKSGGVYFIHRRFNETIFALRTLVEEKIGQGCEFRAFPILDAPNARDMLVQDYQAEVEEKCQAIQVRIAKAMAEAKSKGKIGLDPLTYAKFNAEYQGVLGKSEDMTRMLGQAQGRAGTALTSTLEVLMTVADNLAA